MKTHALILLTLLESAACFISKPSIKITKYAPISTTSSLSQSNKGNKISEITHELEELGYEIKPHVMDHEPHPISADAAKGGESMVHKLRRELREKDKLYHALLDEMEVIETRQVGMKELQTVMETTLNELKHQNAMLRHDKNKLSNGKQPDMDTLKALLNTIQGIHDNLVEANAYAVAWETAEVELWREKQEHTKLDQERESVRRLLWQATKLMGQRVKNFVKWVFFGKDKKATKG